MRQSYGPAGGYTGSYPGMARPGWGAAPGHCRKCGQPSGQCSCGCRECRREAKELLVAGATRDQQDGDNAGGDIAGNKLSGFISIAALKRLGTTGKAFIGGSCCVTLSVEYAPEDATATFDVLVGTVDSEGTTLIWGKEEQPGTGYRVHECIITTKPGAQLTALANNCTVRVRWCEVFSC